MQYKNTYTLYFVSPISILVFQKFILDAFVSGIQVDVIYTDFSKSFDKVNYTIYIYTIHNIGIRDYLGYRPIHQIVNKL